MKTTRPNRSETVALAGHSGAGKTSLVEAIRST